MPTCTDSSSFTSKMSAAKAATEAGCCKNEAALKQQLLSLDLGFDVNSYNLCEAALPARINF